jgi:hypothetical protein
MSKPIAKTVTSLIHGDAAQKYPQRRTALRQRIDATWGKHYEEWEIPQATNGCGSAPRRE